MKYNTSKTLNENKVIVEQNPQLTLTPSSSVPTTKYNNSLTSTQAGRVGIDNTYVNKTNQTATITNEFNSCLPSSMRAFANFVRVSKEKLKKDLGVDDKMLTLLAKTAIGIMGRETTFGKGTDLKDDASEFITNLGGGDILKSLESGYNTVRGWFGKSPQSPSLGAAQFTRETWNRYGLDKTVGPFENSFNEIRQGVGTMFRVNTDYKKAVATGNGTGPSVNPIAVKQGKITSIKGTGNNALDLAIVSHNMPNLINKWCKTSDPNYAGPCNSQTFQPFPESKPQLKVTVYQNQPIPNYFPNKGSGDLTSIGYLEEVAGYINQYSCFTV